MKKVIRYKCSYCQKLAAKPETIEQHEQECIHNPDSKNCYKCHYAVQGGFRDNYYGGTDYEKEMPYCMMNEIPLNELRSSGHTALSCCDWKPGDMYFAKYQDADGGLHDYFGKPIDLFGGKIDEEGSN